MLKDADDTERALPGSVRYQPNRAMLHRRRHPVENRFVYPVFYLLLNTEELDSWVFGVNRRRPLGFHFADHGNGRDPRLWVKGVSQSTNTSSSAEEALR
jgi:DUF1365 family protein